MSIPERLAVCVDRREKQAVQQPEMFRFLRVQVMPLLETNKEPLPSTNKVGAQLDPCALDANVVSGAIAPQ